MATSAVGSRNILLSPFPLQADHPRSLPTSKLKYRNRPSPSLTERAANVFDLRRQLRPAVR